MYKMLLQKTIDRIGFETIDINKRSLAQITMER